jgi:hypothetical protein
VTALPDPGSTTEKRGDPVMKKNKNEAKRLSLSRETLANLDLKSLSGLAGGTVCQESYIVCSIMHTCWSCPATELCA